MEYRIEPIYDGIQLKSYLLRTLGLSSAILTELKKRPDGLLINGEHVTVRYILKTGDILSVSDEDREASEHIVPVKLPLCILYEDRDYIVLNKPPYMPTHPSHGHFDDTLANALAYYFESKNEPFVFRSCSRLDRDTSGVVTVAKNRAAAYRFHEAHLSGGIEKTYLAVLHGTMPDTMTLFDGPIRRREESVITRIVAEDGQPALTRCRVLGYGKTPAGEPLTFVSANPVTGRTHQLRVHFSHAGYPILGDFLYGKEEPELIGRQALHCVKTSFPHPSLGRVTVSAALPDDMARLFSDSCDTDQILLQSKRKEESGR
ncbi:MAG: RluA family pseudouridine synthase [Clostridia bacterium]|nr:RluA family pseudouridine synthase [Clostridia bacterium]